MSQLFQTIPFDMPIAVAMRKAAHLNMSTSSKRRLFPDPLIHLRNVEINSQDHTL